MTDTKQLIKDDLSWMDAPIESDKWTLLWFDKKGNIHKCINDIFPSQDEAENHYKGLMADTISHDAIRFYMPHGTTYLLFKRLIAHAIPMPVKE